MTQTQTKHQNRQKMWATDTCFCEKSFNGRSFFVLEILKGGTLYPTLIPLWLHKSENAMVNRVYGHIEKSDLVVEVPSYHIEEVKRNMQEVQSYIQEVHRIMEEVHS